MVLNNTKRNKMIISENLHQVVKLIATLEFPKRVLNPNLFGEMLCTEKGYQIIFKSERVEEAPVIICNDFSVVLGQGAIVPNNYDPVFILAGYVAEAGWDRTIADLSNTNSILLLGLRLRERLERVDLDVQINESLGSLDVLFQAEKLCAINAVKENTQQPALILSNKEGLMIDAQQSQSLKIIFDFIFDYFAENKGRNSMTYLGEVV